MNKKVLTLCAGFLLAGSLATLDAKVTFLSTNQAPEVGKSYVLVTGNHNTNIWFTSDLSYKIDPTTTIAFGNDWKLESNGKGAFYLKNDAGKYLSVEGNGSYKCAVVGKAENAIAFTYDEDNDRFLVAETETLNGTSLQEGYILAYSSANQALYIVNVVDQRTNYVVSAAMFSAPEAFDGNELMPTIGGDYYYLGLENSGSIAKVLKNDGTFVALTTTGEDDAYLWKVKQVGSDASKIVYEFTNKANGKKILFDATTAGYDNGFNLTNTSEGGSNLVFGLYRSALVAQTGATLNDFLGEGFELTFKVAKDDNTVVELDGAFANTLVAVVKNGSKYEPLKKGAANASVQEFKIKSGNQFLVLNTEKKTGINSYEGVFELVSKADMEKGGKYASDFQLQSYYGEDQQIINRLIVKDDDGTEYYAYIITTTANKTKAYLTATTSSVLEDNEKWPYITLGSNNYVAVEDLIGKYWTFSFAETDVDKDEAYKVGGVLATYTAKKETTKKADFVDGESVLLTSPETHWGVTAVNASAGTVTLQNRESGIQIENVRFRKDGNVWVIASASVTDLVDDKVKANAVKIEGTKHFDGFMTAIPNELRNQVFHIGQYHNETGNTTGFWAENHQANASHQLGVIADEEAAGEWTLRLDMRLNKKGNESSKVDTVYIITPLAGVKNGQIVNGLNADTLAILPYQIQNKANLEYVYLGENGQTYFYQCQEDYSWEGVGSTKPNKNAKAAERFALKMKPNGTYNILPLGEYNEAGRKDNELTNALTISGFDNKVYVANSNKWGSLDNFEAYKSDDNSLMVITPIDRPEYRKIEVANDTIKLWINENESQVVYEKRDDKSVVAGDTLSFLNIDNDNQFDMNPAIYADTAYVNRTVNGVANTCYQYLLAVNITKKLDTYCPEDEGHNDPAWIAEHGVCPHAIKTPYVEGRFLVNLIDTANIYGDTHIHNNPYINQTEEGNDCAKLSFVNGKHVGDKLYLYTNDDTVTVDLSKPAFNVAKFAFKYDNVKDGSFKIQTLWKEYAPAKKEADREVSQEGYLRYVNGCLVVDKTYQKGYVFNMTERYTEQAPTANEEIAAGNVVVAGVDGAVVVKGAEGKNVIVSTILGKVVANEVVSSDNATIAAPAGIVVVSVDGESFKVVVK